MKHLMSFAVLGLCLHVVAVPQVEIQSVSQDAVTHLVTVTYSLSGAPAIVTAPENCHSAQGDVNRLIETDGDHTAYWQPELDMSDVTIPTGAELQLKAWDVSTPPPYMVVPLDAVNASTAVRFYVSSNAVPRGVTDDLYKTSRLLMRRIPAANVKWRMGQPDGGGLSDNGDEITHYVTLEKDFYIGVYPVTQRQFEHVWGSNLSNFSTYEDSPTRPAEKVRKDHQLLRGYAGDSGWPTNGYTVTDDSFIGLLRGRSGIKFDLPTEAQWEFACRAGNECDLYTGAWVWNSWGLDVNVDKVAWFGWTSASTKGNSGGVPHPVGLKMPNAFGLYDMLGNVYETCLDNYKANLGTADVVDPKGPEKTERPAGMYARVLRGGAIVPSQWGIAGNCRAANRAYKADGYVLKENGGNFNWWDFCPYVGFRLACPADLKNW